jgi:hypothetical protein
VHVVVRGLLEPPVWLQNWPRGEVTPPPNSLEPVNVARFRAKVGDVIDDAKPPPALIPAWR